MKKETSLVKKASILNLPGEFSGFFMSWLGICFHHCLREDSQLWYRILSPIFLLSFFVSVLSIGDFVFMDIITGSLMFHVLNSGLYPEEKVQVRQIWKKAMEGISGKSEEIADKKTEEKNEPVDAGFEVTGEKQISERDFLSEPEKIKIEK